MKFATIFAWILILVLHPVSAFDQCDKQEITGVPPPKECLLSDKITKLFENRKKSDEKGATLIRGIIDPMDATPLPDDPLTPVIQYIGSASVLGSSLMLMIIFFPVIAGIFTLVIARNFQPEINQRQDRDRWGFRVKQWPLLPLSFLQKSSRDDTFTKSKEPRGTVQSICRTSSFNTTDLVLEVSVDTHQSQSSDTKDRWGSWDKFLYLIKMYHFFNTLTQKKQNLDPILQKLAKATTTGNKKKVAPAPQMADEDFNIESYFPVNRNKWKVELQMRQPQLRKLWLKLKSWINNIPERQIQIQQLKKDKLKKLKYNSPVNELVKVPSTESQVSSTGDFNDSDDSYWGSSESFSSDEDSD